MDAVLNVLHWSPLSRRRSEERGRCPVHCSTAPRSRSFSVDRRRNCFQCFSCGAKGNQLDLFAQTRKLDLYPAAIELCRLVGIDVPYLSNGEQRRGTRPARKAEVVSYLQAQGCGAMHIQPERWRHKVGKAYCPRCGKYMGHIINVERSVFSSVPLPENGKRKD